MRPVLVPLSVLPAGELAAQLAEAYRLIGELTARNERLAARVEDLAPTSFGPKTCAHAANLTCGHQPHQPYQR
jgi:hypothetical protein